MSIFGSLVLSLMFACGEEDAVVEEAPQVVEEAPKPTEKSTRDVLKEFKVQAGQGKIAKAQESLKNMKDASANSEFHLAGAAGWSGADLSVLTSHADWAALVAGQSQQAYDAATSAGMKSLAVVRGATSGLVAEWESSKSKKRSKETEERTWTAEESLELLIATGDTSFLSSAQAVTDWAGQLALAEWAQSQQNAEVAATAFANAAAIEGMGQLYAGALSASFAKDVDGLKDIIGKASGIGDVVAGMAAVDGLVSTHLTNGTLSGLWTDSAEALKAEHKMKLSEASWEMLALTRVGLLTGHTGDVREQIGKLVEQAEGSVLSDALFYGTVVATRLMDTELDAKIADKEGASAIRSMFTTGTGVDALTVEKQYLVASTVAPMSGSFSEKQLPLVLKQPLPPVLSLQLSLLHLDWTRHQGKSTEAAIDALMKAHADKGNLQMELSVRKSLQVPSSTVQVPTVEEPGAMIKAWSHIAGGTSSKIDVQDRNSKALVAWMNLLDSQRTGKSMDSMLDDVWQNTPFHRTGSLSTHTALDFSDGAGFTDVFRGLVGKDGDAQTMSAVGLLEMARTVQQRHSEGFEGRTGVAALTSEERRSMMVALESVRAGMMEFWMGGAFPDDAFAALSEAEKGVMNQPKNTHLYNQTVVSARSTREQLNTISSVISIVEDNGQYLAGVLSPNASTAVVLGSVKSINKQVDKHYAALQAGLNDTKVNHLPGNDLRRIVLGPKPIAKALTGVGKYLIVVPPTMTRFGFSTLPEQKEGLRFFANTPRDITLSTSLDAMWSANQVYSDYELDMLAFGRSTAEEKWVPSVTDADKSSLLTNQGFSPEVGLIKVHFSDSAKVLVKDEATVEAFVTNAPKARYIYLSEIPATADGGFEMADGTISLDEITGLDLHAMVVFIGPDRDPLRQANRVEAFMQAGAQAVIVQSWAVPANDLRLLVENLFMNLKRNDPLLVAMKKTRSKYIGEQSKDGYQNNPAKWGGFTIYSRP